MADSTYQAGIYRRQGGNELVIAPAGLLNVQGQLTGLQSGKKFVTGSAVGSVTGSVAGASANDGFSYVTPKATLIQGQTLATASTGDRVHVMPGHVESVTGAAGMTFSKAGVRYIGEGVGRNRPKISFTTAIDAQIIISGANIAFHNFVFDFAGFDAITAAISITGADVSFDDCEFITNVADKGVVLGILTAATATRLRFSRCRFIGTPANTGTTTTAQIKHEVGVDYVIEDCYFCGKVVNNLLNATTILQGLIARNIFHTGTGTASISLEAASTPFIVGNDFCVASGTAPVIGAGASYSDNHYTTEGNGPTAGTALAF